ncbi:efflux RND transporter periplasmic adaptor subunit [Rhizobium sp. BR 317]|uniref:efflux RND transporter periplasmic adaptor subunit n=1 Tax=Rhizobium sp. BR 317 TaxID=3040015 RepID=UPI0039BFAFEF
MGKWAIIMGFALTLALSSCDQNDKQAKQVPQSVRTVEAALSKPTAKTTVTGEVKARIESELSFRVSGRIVERNVDVGAKVKAGDLLAKIDPQEQQADVDVATASLQAAEAQLTQAQLADARQESLFKNQVTTRAAYDAARETLLTAQGTEEAAKAQLETAKDALSYTELRADADGIITERNAEVGQVAQAAQSVFTLAHDGPRDAVFNVFESLFLKERPDKQVEVALISNAARRVSATVREISPTIDGTTGTIRVKVGLENGASMPLGAAVTGTFSMPSAEAIVLPWGAMASAGGQPAVWVVDPATSEVSLRKVQVAEYDTGQFAVSAGLKPHEIVVAEGGKFLRPGQHVDHSQEAAK